MVAGNTINVRMRVAQPGDWIRVVTAISNPSTFIGTTTLSNPIGIVATTNRLLFTEHTVAAGTKPP